MSEATKWIRYALESLKWPPDAAAVAAMARSLGPSVTVPEHVGKKAIREFLESMDSRPADQDFESRRAGGMDDSAMEDLIDDMLDEIKRLRNERDLAAAADADVSEGCHAIRLFIGCKRVLSDKLTQQQAQTFANAANHLAKYLWDGYSARAQEGLVPMWSISEVMKIEEKHAKQVRDLRIEIGKLKDSIREAPVAGWKATKPGPPGREVCSVAASAAAALSVAVATGTSGNITVKELIERPSTCP